MPTATVTEDQTVHQEVKITPQIEAQIENMVTQKMAIAPRLGRLHEKVPTETTPMELIQVR